LGNSSENLRTILLLHGLGVYGESWGYQVQALADAGYKVIAPDLPGFGMEPPVAKRWSIQTSAKAMAERMSQAGVSEMVVCGLSMGGTVALQMALDYPTKVAGIVLINTFAALRPANLSEVVYFIRRGARAYLIDPAHQAQLVADTVFPHPDQAEWRERLVESICAANPKIYRQAMLALARFNVVRKLEKLNLPVMVISGKQDTTIPPQVQHRMAVSIPGAEWHEIDQAGHGVIIDQKETVNRLLIDFMHKVYSS